MKGKWKMAYFCMSCEKRLSHHATFNNNGLCPKCGVKKPGAGTVVAVNEKAIRKIYKNKLYKFFGIFDSVEFKRTDKILKNE